MSATPDITDIVETIRNQAGNYNISLTTLQRVIEESHPNSPNRPFVMELRECIDNLMNYDPNGGINKFNELYTQLQALVNNAKTKISDVDPLTSGSLKTLCRDIERNIQKNNYLTAELKAIPQRPIPSPTPGRAFATAYEQKQAQAKEKVPQTPEVVPSETEPSQTPKPPSER